jgi:N-acyl homoserine lactone hydrolase
MARQRGFNRQDFDLGHKIVQVDGEHDVFGDGSVICLPTYGHTPGHQSLKLRLGVGLQPTGLSRGGEIVLAADSCYFCRTLRERRLPKYVYDREAMHASLDRLARLEAGGARIFFGHDGAFWQSVPQAPAVVA